MERAEGDGEFVGDLAAEGSWLGVGYVMCERRDASTDETRLSGNEPEVPFITHTLRLGDGELGFVDAACRW